MRRPALRPHAVERGSLAGGLQRPFRAWLKHKHRPCLLRLGLDEAAGRVGADLLIAGHQHGDPGEIGQLGQGVEHLHQPGLHVEAAWTGGPVTASHLERQPRECPDRPYRVQMPEQQDTVLAGPPPSQVRAAADAEYLGPGAEHLAAEAGDKVGAAGGGRQVSGWRLHGHQRGELLGHEAAPSAQGGKRAHRTGRGARGT